MPLRREALRELEGEVAPADRRRVRRSRKPPAVSVRGRVLKIGFQETLEKLAKRDEIRKFEC